MGSGRCWRGGQREVWEGHGSRCGRGRAGGVGGAQQQVWERQGRYGRGTAAGGVGGARQQVWEGQGKRCERALIHTLTSCVHCVHI